MGIDDIALTMIPGLGIRGAVHLLEIFDSAESIFSASMSDLLHTAELREDIARSITKKCSHSQAEKELNYCRKHDILPISSTDAAYPPLLREIPDYPHILYVQGNPQVLSQRCISMVGTRRISTYGQRLCNDLVHGLANVRGLVIVSGLAFGVDVGCHRAAMDCDIPTVGVLPNPLPEVTPAQHANIAKAMLQSGGALVSELHSQSKLRGQYYLPRNRLIAGLSAGTVIVESPANGGSLATALFADGYGRTVMAPPGRITDGTSFGTNALIRNHKAVLICTPRDIIEELQWELQLSTEEQKEPIATPELTAEEERILALMGDDPISLAELLVASDVSYADLSVTLMGLELSGAVRQLPGSRYEKLR
jgi:DNA processing protein